MFQHETQNNQGMEILGWMGGKLYHCSVGPKKGPKVPALLLIPWCDWRKLLCPCLGAGPIWDISKWWPIFAIILVSQLLIGKHSWQQWGTCRMTSGLAAFPRTGLLAGISLSTFPDGTMFTPVQATQTGSVWRLSRRVVAYKTGMDESQFQDVDP